VGLSSSYSAKLTPMSVRRRDEPNPSPCGVLSTAGSSARCAVFGMLMCQLFYSVLLKARGR